MLVYQRVDFTNTRDSTANLGYEPPRQEPAPTRLGPGLYPTPMGIKPEITTSSDPKTLKPKIMANLRYPANWNSG